MKCVICKQGDTKAAKVTVTVTRGRTTLVFRAVPAQVCATCGEEYVDADATKALLEQAERAAQAGVEVEVRPYAAA
jgi:YgiT-type zinc finger domain-containing protein